MRWLITRGCCLALGLLAARVDADEIQWRAAAPRPIAQTAPLPTSPSSVVSLQRPIAIAGPSDAPGTVSPVSFQTATLETPRPLVRAHSSDAAQPLPPGPTLTGEEILGPPRPLIAGKGTPPVAANSDIVSRWVGDCPDIVGGGPVVTGTIDGAYGPAACDPCGTVCCDVCAPACCDVCGPVCCDTCCFGDRCCGDRGHFWFRGEYLLWAFKREFIPPLVTANSLGAPASLAAPGTVVLFGNQGGDNKDFSGGRFTVGFWCCSCPDLGFEGSYFFLGQQNKTWQFGSNGNPSLGRPLDIANPITDALGNTIPPGENVEQVAQAPGTSGSVSVATRTQFWGAEVNGRYKWLCGPCWHVDFLSGFRYLELNENLDITENLLTTGAFRGGTPIAAGGATGIVVSDRFGARNQFFGGQIGLDTEVRWCRWFLGGQVKLAMGDMHEVVRIGGDTTFIPPAPAMPIAQTGGVLALASNSGTFTRNRFAVVPEVGLKFGLQVTDHMRIFAGYNFMYLSDVVRPADQIDRRVNTNQLANVFQGTRLVQPALPTVLFKETDFWAQGLNAGMEFRY